MKKKLLVLLVSIVSALSACSSANSEERMQELEAALIDAGYASEFVPMDEDFIEKLTWVKGGVASECLAILEVDDSEMLARAAETGYLASADAEVWLVEGDDVGTAVNGDFILARARQSGDSCGSVYEKYLDIWDSVEASYAVEAKEKQAEIALFFQEID